MDRRFLLLVAAACATMFVTVWTVAGLRAPAPAPVVAAAPPPAPKRWVNASPTVTMPAQGAVAAAGQPAVPDAGAAAAPSATAAPAPAPIVASAGACSGQSPPGFPGSPPSPGDVVCGTPAAAPVLPPPPMTPLS